MTIEGVDVEIDFSVEMFLKIAHHGQLGRRQGVETGKNKPFEGDFVRIFGNVFGTIAIEHPLVTLTFLSQLFSEQSVNIGEQVVELQFLRVAFRKVVLSKRNLEFGSVGVFPQDDRNILQLHVHVADVLEECVPPREEVVQFETFPLKLAGYCVQVQQLGCLVDNVERRQPPDEILHWENLRREHRFAAIGFMQALEQLPSRTPVRQNHRDIM